MKKTLIFDLDGTLLDSLKDIALSMNEVLDELNLKQIELQKYRYFVGGGVDELSKNIVDYLHVNIDFKIISSRFKQVYESVLHENTKPYDGIYQMLEQLQGNNLAICSNKPHDITNSYAKKFFSDYGFSQVFGQRKNVPKKPDPQCAIAIAKAFDVTCKDVYFVGDTKVDMQTAKGAGMKSIGVLWGFRDEKELRENSADFIVSSPNEIINIIS